MNGRLGRFDEDTVQGQGEPISADLTTLVEKRRQLELEIKGASEITEWRSQMAIRR